MILDRRAAIGLVIGGVGFPMMAVGAQPSEASQGRPFEPMSVLLNMDQYKDFTVLYKGKSVTYTTDQVMNALFGEGTFGNNNIAQREPVQKPEFLNQLDATFRKTGKYPEEITVKPVDIDHYLMWARDERIFVNTFKNDDGRFGVFYNFVRVLPQKRMI